MSQDGHIWMYIVANPGRPVKPHVLELLRRFYVICGRCGRHENMLVYKTCEEQQAFLVESRLLGEHTYTVDEREWVRDEFGFEFEEVPS